MLRKKAFGSLYRVDVYKKACVAGGVAAIKGAAETQQSFSGRAGACPESEGRTHCPARAGKHTLLTCLMWSNITKKTTDLQL